MSMTRYIFPAVVLVLLLLFFLGLPDLSITPIGSLSGQKNHRRQALDRTDLLLMLGICLVFGAVDFAMLGSLNDPHTYAMLSEEEAVLTFEAPGTPTEVRFFTGVGYGEYTISLSQDGTNYFDVTHFTQDAGDVLRWEILTIETGWDASFARITGTGNAWLGEVAFFSADGTKMQATSSVAALCDEPETVRRTYDFYNSSYFDEIYHARTAWEHLNKVAPYEISHPPLGKILISFGIALFGMSPFGWRFSGTLFGVLMLPVMYVFIKKMFGSRRAAFCGTLVFASDFMHFVQTRIATIDTYAVFFILLMYLFMYLFVTKDDWTMLALCGISFGLGAASKWTCIYAGAGLAVLWALYWICNRRKGFRIFACNAFFCVAFFVIVPCAIYYLSYLPYGKAANVRGIFNREYWDIVISNQEYMFSYHSSLVAEHPYSSKWYQWMLDIRPILYYLQYFDDGTRSSFGAFLNPVLCWGGLLALFVLVYRAVWRRDGDAAFLLIGYLAQLLPWVFVPRLTFAYHYFPCSIFLVLALAYVFRLMEKGNRYAGFYISAFTGVSLVLFVVFYPALSGMRVDNAAASQLLGWLPTWPF
ncbi:MAG: glycosyltransferase family 39 protein [Oscillospiraceae bacterium]|nr:glycosyltransferase family 39 protein [Oscillospiraceae bacterium]